MALARVQGRAVLIFALLLFILSALLSLKSDLRAHVLQRIQPQSVANRAPGSTLPPAAEEKPKWRPYKPRPERRTAEPLVDNFPRAAKAKSRADLPPVPPWNAPPRKHVPEKTPLFIGFTRNWLLLQQAVVSYITAGWPPEDIYVVENTGTMLSNRDGKLTLRNPFYMDHRRLTKVFGVNVITTPAVLSFAQLQSLYLYTALEKGWTHYFWSHMDIIATADEARAEEPYESLYMRAVGHLRDAIKSDKKWAIYFFAYDWLALVNVTSFEAVGGWDTMIGYYGVDCDMHERLSMEGYELPSVNAGWIADVGQTYPDLEVLYRTKKHIDLPERPYGDDGDGEKDKRDFSESNNRPASLVESSGKGDDAPDERNSTTYHRIQQLAQDWIRVKNDPLKGIRNRWQSLQNGGEGEPYYKDPDGFRMALEINIKAGGAVMESKWGHRGCDLRGSGMNATHAWRVEKDFESDCVIPNFKLDG